MYILNSLGKGDIVFTLNPKLSRKILMKCGAFLFFFLSVNGGYELEVTTYRFKSNQQGIRDMRQDSILTR